jgi:tRNA (guanine37-N1)-methyltransferase
VLGIKIKKESAQRLINILKNRNLINKEYKIKKENDYVLIPIKEKNEEIKQLKDKFNFEIGDFNFEPTKKKIEEEIYEKLPVKSFDVIGDIAITIIPKGYEDKKEEIGELIAKIAKVKTVLAEKGKREGEFRLQKFECIYGEDKRETIHKENNCKFLVDVEKVYFSPRLGTDRLEIAKEIKENENVLVMFSGVQPYPIVIAKNSKANLVVGIEKNPNAYYYSQKNLILNKTKNVVVFIDDVRNVLPLNKGLVINDKLNEKIEDKMNLFLYKKIISPINLTKAFGIKTSLNKKEFLNKLNGIKENLNKLRGFNIEYFLYKWDEKEKVMEFSKFVENEIKKINPNLILNFYVHQSFEIKENLKEEVLKFIEFFKDTNFKLIIHPMFFNEEGIFYLFDLNEIKELYKKYKNIYFENVYFKPLNSKEEIIELSKERVCLDISHYVIYLLSKLKEKEAVNETYNTIKELINKNIYYHLSNFPPEGSSFEKGILDFDKILPFVENGICEVKSKNEIKGEEMIKSFNYIFEPLKFDRIVMPLPKGSENFLDLAFKNIKKDGIIHWYQFAKKEDIPHLIELAKKEAKKQNKNIEIIKIKEVGQIAPKTYRLRIDIKVK